MFQQKILTLILCCLNMIINTHIVGEKKGWKRPSNWLPRPAIASGEKVVKFLNQVFPDSKNYIRLQCRGAFTVDWGDDNIINYADGTIVEYNIDYSAVTDFFDETETSKQHWVKVTPQSGDITAFIMNTTKTTSSAVGASTNQGVLEILVGELNITGSYNLYMSSMHNLQSILFVEDFSTNYNLTNSFLNNYGLQHLDGNFTSNVYNSGMFANCYNLRYVDNFNLVCTGSVTAQGIFQSYGGDVLDLPNFLFSTGRSFVFLSSNIKSLSLDISEMLNAYQLAYNAYQLEELNLYAGDGGNSATYYQAFYNCNFKETPALNLNSSSSNANMFDFNYGLYKSNLTNIKASIGFRNCNLDHSAVLELANQCIYNSTGYTVDLRDNPNIVNLPAATIAIFTAANATVLIS